MPFQRTVGVSNARLYDPMFWRSQRSSGCPAGVHGSMREPPHEQLISPTGTFSSLWSVSPKKNATALCGGIVSGVVSTHDASRSSSGSYATLCGGWK